MRHKISIDQLQATSYFFKLRVGDYFRESITSSVISIKTDDALAVSLVSGKMWTPSSNLPVDLVSQPFTITPEGAV